jgi:hypothetical protein
MKVIIVLYYYLIWVLSISSHTIEYRGSILSLIILISVNDRIFCIIMAMSRVFINSSYPYPKTGM